MWLNHVERLELQFATRDLEERVRNLCTDKNEQIIGFLAKTSFKGCMEETRIAKIAYVIPFPNNSQIPEEEALPPNQWANILDKIWGFYNPLYYRNDEKLWIGWGHSHPQGINDFSSADIRFMQELTKKYWFMNGHFSLLVTWLGKRTFRYRAAYFYNENKDAKTKYVNKNVMFRSFFHKPYPV